MYSSPVCPPGYVKKLQSPSLDFALRASVASRHCSQICLEQIWAHTLRSKSEVHGCTLSKFAPGNFVTKGAAIGQEPRCREAQGSARAAISSIFYYASQTNRTTLHAVITMDGVYAGFAWSKNLSNYGI